MSYQWDSFAVGAQEPSAVISTNLLQLPADTVAAARAVTLMELQAALHATGGAATGGPSRPGLAGSLYDVFSGGCVSYSFNSPESSAP
jgi:hypothetical protein